MMLAPFNHFFSHTNHIFDENRSYHLKRQEPQGMGNKLDS